MNDIESFLLGMITGLVILVATILAGGVAISCVPTLIEPPASSFIGNYAKSEEKK